MLNLIVAPLALAVDSSSLSILGCDHESFPTISPKDIANMKFEPIVENISLWCSYVDNYAPFVKMGGLVHSVNPQVISYSTSSRTARHLSLISEIAGEEVSSVKTCSGKSDTNCDDKPDDQPDDKPDERSIIIDALYDLANPISNRDIKLKRFSLINDQIESSDIIDMINNLIDNASYIEKSNNSNKSFKLKINQFSHMSPQQFKAYVSKNKSTPSEKKSILTVEASEDVTLPESVDWVKQGTIAPVKNQMACGSCWAFSSVAALENAYAIKTGNLLAFSEQQYVDCSGATGNLGCEGGLYERAYVWTERHGVCTEDSYPYKGTFSTCRLGTGVDDDVAPNMCEIAIPTGGVVDMVDVKPLDEKSMQVAIQTNALNISIVGSSRILQSYESGIIDTDDDENVELDHAVLLTGYGTEDGTPYWIMRNSWGASWGDEGYARIKRNVIKQGLFGLAREPVYPVLTKAELSVPVPGPGPDPIPVDWVYERPPCREKDTFSFNTKKGAVCVPPCDENYLCPSNVPYLSTAEAVCMEFQPARNAGCILNCLTGDECGLGMSCDMGACVWSKSKY